MLNRLQNVYKMLAKSWVIFFCFFWIYKGYMCNEIGEIVAEQTKIETAPWISS